MTTTLKGSSEKNVETNSMLHKLHQKIKQFGYASAISAVLLTSCGDNEKSSSPTEKWSEYDKAKIEYNEINEDIQEKKEEMDQLKEEISKLEKKRAIKKELVKEKYEEAQSESSSYKDTLVNKKTPKKK